MHLLARRIFDYQLLSLLLISIVGWVPTARADRAPIVISRDTKSRISDLKFGWPKFVKADPLNDTGERAYVIVIGAFAKPNWHLYMNGVKLSLDAKRRFARKILIQPRVTDVNFVAKGPGGKEEKETLSILVVDWEGSVQNVLFGPPRFRLTPALGVAYFSYQQTNLADFTEISLTAKAQAQFIYAPPNWSLLGTLSGSLFSITANTSDANVRLLNFDLVGGYTFHFGNSGLSLALMPGFHYKTTFVTNNDFGYFNLAGPQLYTNLSYQFRSGDRFGIYAKLGPLVRNGRVLSLKNFEFAQGVGPVFLLKSGHIMPLMVETSFLTLELDSKTASAFHAMLTLGYSL